MLTPQLGFPKIRSTISIEHLYKIALLNESYSTSKSQLNSSLKLLHQLSLLLAMLLDILKLVNEHVYEQAF